MEPTGDPYPTQDTGTRPLPEDIDLLPGEFGTRYEIALPYEENQSIVSWKEGFEGPEIFVNDPNGRRRVTNKSDFIRPRTFTASDSIESEGESSVISVDDLGFSDAPTESLPQFRDFCNHLEKNQACSKTEPFMSVEELRLHLGCSEGPANTIEELIGNKMEESFEKSKQDNEDYLPLDAFEAIFDIEAIKSLVKETYSKDTEPNLKEMIAHIIGNEPNQGYRRILGALVLMNQVIRIQDFIKEGIRDYDLPIKRSPQDNKGFDTRTGIYNDTLFQGWSRNDIELFYVYQKKLFVPFFNIQEDKLCSYVFDSNVRLPWKDFEQKTSGGNGLVHRVEIHSKHHNFRPSNNLQKPLYFALKEIFTLDRDAYRRELWALEKSVAHAQRENHLIKLLLTFQHGEVCYLLFEWADGNLADFWEQIEIAPALSDTWAVDQCLGISNAIKRIHGLATWQKRRRSSRGSESDNERDWGRHGDIKPNNILWFSVYTTDSNETLHDHLVVSDLGLTRYHSQDTRSAVHRSHLEGCTWGYRPPEMDTERLISSSYDIWSLGCVFLEFCVWYINGGKAVQIFGIEREKQDESEIRGVFEDKYFNITTDEHGRRQVCLKPIVEEYLNTRLRESDRYTPFVEHMLNLIQHKMLVIDPKERWKIDRICTEIFNIKSEIAKIETPVAEPAHAVDALLRVADQGTPSEGRPPMDPDSLPIDDLVHHAQGNSGGAWAESKRCPAISIHSRGGDSDNLRDSQSPGDDSFTDAAETQQDILPPNISSEGTQKTFDGPGTSPLVTDAAKAATTQLRPRSSIQSEYRTTETHVLKVTQVNTVNEQIYHNDKQLSRRQRAKVNISRGWAVIRDKIERYVQKVLGSWGSMRRNRTFSIPHTT